MTLTLDLTKEEEDRLISRASKAGLSPAEYIRSLIDGNAIPCSTGDRIRAALGDRPAGSGTSTWSEVEAACDPH